MQAALRLLRYPVDKHVLLTYDVEVLCSTRGGSKDGQDAALVLGVGIFQDLPETKKEDGNNLGEQSIHGKFSQQPRINPWSLLRESGRTQEGQCLYLIKQIRNQSDCWVKLRFPFRGQLV